MHFVHAVRYLSSKTTERELREIGVVDADGAFDISETDARWPLVGEWIERHRGDELFRDYVGTEFSKEEIAAADWLWLRGGREWGYPQPEKGFGFREVTYDVSEYCDECGVGARQVTPFRMKAEPRWGRRDEILTLGWVFDAFFVRRETFEAVFAPFGVRRREVVDRREVPMETVDIDELVDVAVDEHVSRCRGRRVLRAGARSWIL